MYRNDGALCHFSGRADATRRADVDAQRGIAVAFAFRTGADVDLEEDLAGADRLGRADRFAIATGGAHVGVDFHCHEGSP